MENTGLEPLNTKTTKEPTGHLNGLEKKTKIEGTANKYILICTHCWKDFIFHKGRMKLKDHLNSKYLMRSNSSSNAWLNVHIHFLVIYRSVLATLNKAFFFFTFLGHILNSDYLC